MGQVEGSRGESGIDGRKGKPGQMVVGMGQVDGSRGASGADESRSEPENKGNVSGSGRMEREQRIWSRSSRLSAERG